MEGVIYRPSLLASGRVRILDRKLGVDSEIVRTTLVNAPEKRGSIRWEDYFYNGPSLEEMDMTSVPSARFGTIDSPLNDTKLMTALQKDFTDWVYRNSSVKARANQALKVYAGPDVSQAEFMKACAEAARDARDAEIEKKTAVIDRQIKALEDKLDREERELERDQNELAGRKREENSNLLEIGAGALGIGRKRSITSQFSKNRLTSKAKAEVNESIDAIAQYKQQIADLQKRREDMVAELNDKWGKVVGNVSEVTVAPKKSDVFVTLFGVAWLPYYMVKTNTGTMELPAFGAQ
jgi:flagellar motility protein MotE (MotC chaperone)